MNEHQPCDRSEWTRVVDTATEVLARNPSNTKALYRRAVAFMGQEKRQDAVRDLNAVLQLDPGSADARNKLAEVQTQLRAARDAEREQAEKMRGFLRGERLEDTVAVSPDGGVRKLHGNENAPLFASWIKRQWLSPNSDVSGVVTCHVLIKSGDKEIFNSRSSKQGRAAAPVRWVLDDPGTFQAWNAAVKTIALREKGRFEIAGHTLVPSVQGAIERCVAKWKVESESFQEVPDQVKSSMNRRQALQILGLPEELCALKNESSLYSMEMELLEAQEYTNIGDGRFLRVSNAGKDSAQVEDLATVSAHFRVSKLPLNQSLKDTRLGLTSTRDGVVVREDRAKEPVTFVVGEEDVDPANFVPHCVGQCLLIPERVTEGTAVKGLLTGAHQGYFNESLGVLFLQFTRHAFRTDPLERRALERNGEALRSCSGRYHWPSGGLCRGGEGGPDLHRSPDASLERRGEHHRGAASRN